MVTEQVAKQTKETLAEPNRPEMRNPYLFIVGCPRSGTTLLKRMVDAHPEIAITRETHWITRFYKSRIGLTRERRVTQDLIPKLFEYHRFPHLKISRNFIERLVKQQPDMPYEEFVSKVFELYAKKEKKPLAGDKTPGYVRSVSLLHKLWPQAKFVHIIRDGRDACLSLLKWRLADRSVGSFPTWHEDQVSTTALWWEWHVRLGIEAGRPLGEGLYCEVKYEMLVNNPEDQCMALCAFLGVKYDQAMPAFHEGRTKTDSGLSANSAWIPATQGLRDWRSQMAEGDIERFEAISGDLLYELGYPLENPNPKQNDLTHALKIRKKFIEYARSTKGRIPERWQ